MGEVVCKRQISLVDPSAIDYFIIQQRRNTINFITFELTNHGGHHLLTNHIAQSVILFVDRENRCVGYFGVLLNYNSDFEMNWKKT